MGLRPAGGLGFDSAAVALPRVLVPLNRIPAPPPTGLGCGDYSVAIFARGGGRQLAQLEWSSLNWSRKIDDTSTAQVKVAGISGRSSDCCGVIASVEPWIHELGIIRGDDRVWCGPALKVSFDPDSDTATIDASDLSLWLTRRKVHDDHFYTNVDLAVMFSDYVYDAMLPENSAGVIVDTTLCGITGTRQTLAASNVIVMDVLGELARTGIDWTVIDRYMLAGGLVVPQSPAFTLIDEHFIKNPASVKDGSNSATLWGVIGGQDAAEQQVYGEAGGTDPAYSLIERIANEDTILDNASAIAAAQGRLDLTHGAPAIITDGVLSPDAPIDLRSLVAGTRCTVNLRENCVPVGGDYRLSQIDVTVSDRADEQVKLSFQPVGVDTKDN